MKPLIDMDILTYEVGFSCESKKDGVVTPRSWDYTQESIDHKIKLICNEVEADEDPLLFLTDSPYINRLMNKRRKWDDLPPQDFVPNFRNEVATSKDYKGNRIATKPFHYKNIISYVLSQYDVVVNEKGLEADDAMCIMQTSLGDKTIICSRDKDVRQCSGWHYSWECGNQRSLGPIFIEQPGHLELLVPPPKISPKTGKEISGGPPKLRGYGNVFFYAQILMGDGVDNVGGAAGRGPVFAHTLLKDATTEREMYELTAEVYVKTYGDDWKAYYREAADLLWMIREIDEKGNAIRWTPPKKL